MVDYPPQGQQRNLSAAPKPGYTGPGLGPGEKKTDPPRIVKDPSPRAEQPKEHKYLDWGKYGIYDAGEK